MTACAPAVFTFADFNKILNPMRCAGQKSRAALHDQAHVFGMKRIHVFPREHGIQNRQFLNLLRQRQLHQNSMHGGIRVALPD